MLAAGVDELGTAVADGVDGLVDGLGVDGLCEPASWLAAPWVEEPDRVAAGVAMTDCPEQAANADTTIVTDNTNAPFNATPRSSHHVPLRRGGMVGRLTSRAGGPLRRTH